jgi:uncharacterized membrane protein YccC
MKASDFRIRNPLKIAVACVTATVIYNVLNITLGVFSVVSIFVLMNLFYDESFEKGLERLAGAVIYAAIGIWMVNWFYDLPLLYFISMIFWLLIAYYLFALGKYSYCHLMGGVTFSLVMLMGITAPMQINGIVFGWVSGNALGLFLVVLFDKIWPLVRHEQLGERLANSLDALAVDALHYQQLQTQIQSCKHKARKKKLPFNEAAYIKLILAIKHIAIENQTLAGMQQPSIHHPLEVIIKDNLSLSLARLKKAILTKNVSAFEAYELLRLRESLAFRIHQRQKYDEATLFDLEACYALLKRLIGHIQDMHSALSILFSPTGNDNKLNVERLIEHKRSIWPLDILAAKHATKITLGIVLLIWLSVYLGWPAGIQSMIAVVVMTAQTNLGRAHLRFNLRFWGVLVGSFLGLLCLIVLSHFISFSILLIFIFISMFFSSYIAQGPETISYFGIQVGVMIPLVLLFHNGPTVDMTLAIQRFVGVLEAALISAFILYYIWPEAPLVVLKKQVNLGLYHAALFFKDLSVFKLDHLKKEAIQIEQHNQQLLTDTQFLLFGDTHDAKNYAQLIHLMDQLAIQTYGLSEAVALLPQEMHTTFIRFTGIYFKKLIQVLEAQSDLNASNAGCLSENMEASIQRLMHHLSYFNKNRSVSDLDHVHIVAIEAFLLQIARSIDTVSVVLLRARSHNYVRGVTPLS